METLFDDYKSVGCICWLTSYEKVQKYKKTNSTLETFTVDLVYDYFETDLHGGHSRTMGASFNYSSR